MQIGKSEIKGWVGTIIFHAILVLALFWLALTTPLPLPSEGGVEVNLGNSDEGMGTEQPMELQSSAAATPPPPQTAESDELLTDNTEETPAIEPKREVKPKPVEKEEPKPIVKKEPAPKPQPKVDPRAIFPGKSTTGNTTGQGGNEGITGKPGDQGKPFGTPDATGYDGTGGSGGGMGGNGTGGNISFDLTGRTSRQIPRPSNNFKESGTVVCTIYVNKAGYVTRVIAGIKGTTTSSSQLRLLAEQAAKKARFSENNDAPEEQKGTITYIFELN
jgi:outer membrane biosynthesis protein TonB